MCYSKAMTLPPCNGWCNHAGTVSMIDNKGYVYCGPCGIRRRSSGIPCRKLRDHEVNRIAAGLAVERY